MWSTILRFIAALCGFGYEARSSKKPRLYLAGPMTGIKDLNFPAFNAEAARLRAAGYTVMNPAEINPDHSMPWAECMRRDIAVLVTCEGVALLPGWENSRGASIEEKLGRDLGMQVRAAEEFA